jgi:recombinational DNA repair protein RecR
MLQGLNNDSNMEQIKQSTTKCDACNTPDKVEWCYSCNRFMCNDCDNEVHSVSLP